MMTKRGGALLLLALTLVAVLAWWIGGQVADVREAGREKRTEINMIQLSTALRSEQPADTSREAISKLLTEMNLGNEILLDGWGTPLLIERVARGGSPEFTYRIRSLGRNTELNTCCIGDTGGDWEADAVLEGETWLQYW